MPAVAQRTTIIAATPRAVFASVEIMQLSHVQNIGSPDGLVVYASPRGVILRSNTSFGSAAARSQVSSGSDSKTTIAVSPGTTENPIAGSFGRPTNVATTSS